RNSVRGSSTGRCPPRNLWRYCRYCLAVLPRLALRAPTRALPWPAVCARLATPRTDVDALEPARHSRSAARRPSRTRLRRRAPALIAKWSHATEIEIRPELG